MDKILKFLTRPFFRNKTSTLYKFRKFSYTKRRVFGIKNQIIKPPNYTSKHYWFKFSLLSLI